MHGGNKISFSQNKTTEFGGRNLLRFVAFRNNEANKTRTLKKKAKPYAIKLSSTIPVASLEWVGAVLHW